MSKRKIRQLVILNAATVLVNIAVFSKAVLGLSLTAGGTFSIAIAWTIVAASVFVFIKGNLSILNKPETRFLMQNVQTLDNCIGVFEEAIHNGDVFDDNILKNIEQIKRFRRKSATIQDILKQKFSMNEMSYQKFSVVLQDVEHVIYMNMRSILNKIAAFDVEEYETIHKKGVHEDELSQEKMTIYNEYIAYVNDATKTNEDILLKLDRLLLEISRYNSMDGGDVQKLPAMVEMDDLIQHAKLYK